MDTQTTVEHSTAPNMSWKVAKSSGGQEEEEQEAHWVPGGDVGEGDIDKV